jgi:hypothetical protein
MRTILLLSSPSRMNYNFCGGNMSVDCICKFVHTEVDISSSGRATDAVHFIASEGSERKEHCSTGSGSVQFSVAECDGGLFVGI